MGFQPFVGFNSFVSSGIVYTAIILSKFSFRSKQNGGMPSFMTWFGLLWHDPKVGSHRATWYKDGKSPTALIGFCNVSVDHYTARLLCFKFQAVYLNCLKMHFAWILKIQAKNMSAWNFNQLFKSTWKDFRKA